MLDEDELAGNWTLVGDELDQVSGRRARRNLGSCCCCASMRCTAGSRRAVPRSRPGRHLRCPLGRGSSVELGLYEWDGRTIKAHRADIRKYFGFRECSVADADQAADWLAVKVCEKERQVDRVRAELLAHLREERIEPPTRDRVRRIIGTAPRRAEQTQTARIAGRIPAESIPRVLALIARSVDPGDDAEEAAGADVFALVREEPGNASVKTIEREVSS
ncbi:DUF4158 domain-containing protein [Spirillospora sp. CA-294931]|uniref:DUF4158 domain-containing protein n=1 Tax=Spirillospora sp. CA-294931 TaxID=3240042 RepID=UPI003D8F6D0E